MPSIPSLPPIVNTDIIYNAVNAKDVIIWTKILFKPFIKYVTQLLRLKKLTYIKVLSETVKGTKTLLPIQMW